MSDLDKYLIIEEAFLKFWRKKGWYSNTKILWESLNARGLWALSNLNHLGLEEYKFKLYEEPYYDFIYLGLDE